MKKVFFFILAPLYFSILIFMELTFDWWEELAD